VSESTISRTIRGKYIQTSLGTFPLKFFFSRTITAGGASVDEVYLEIRELIEQEDKTRPLSDQKIRERLIERGILLPRRTVAKYRMLLGYPGMSERRSRP
jgi:RNA polymerase sigma-54 factor